MKVEVMEGTQETALASASGEIDASNAPEFEEECMKALSGSKSLALDFSGVTFISSAGLRAILRLRRETGERGGEVRLFSVGETVASVFTMAGLDTIIPMAATRDEALRGG